MRFCVYLQCDWINISDKVAEKNETSVIIYLFLRLMAYEVIEETGHYGYLSEYVYGTVKMNLT